MITLFLYPIAGKLRKPVCFLNKAKRACISQALFVPLLKDRIIVTINRSCRRFRIGGMRWGRLSGPTSFCDIIRNANAPFYHWMQLLNEPIHMGLIISLSSWERMWQCQT
jgi:hypothetical protein